MSNMKPESARRTADPVNTGIAPAQPPLRAATAAAAAGRRRVAIIGYYGNNNAGDEALLSSVLRHIGASPRVSETLVLSSKPELTEKLHGVPAVEGLVPGTFKDLMIRMLGRNRRQFFRSMRRVLACDTLIIGGGGLFWDRKDSNFDLLQFMSVVRLFQVLGKDVFIIGVSALPFHHERSKRMFAKIARHPRTRVIICRDQESAAQFRAARGELTAKNDNVFLTEDIVFALPAPTRLDPVVEQYVTRDGKPTVALGLCGPELDEDPAYRALVGGVIDKLHGRGMHVLLVPMSTGFPDDRKGMADAFAAQIARGAARVVAEDLTVEQNMQLLGAMDCVVGERLHASILALVAGAPIVGISYSPKVALLYERIGKPQWYRHRKDLSAAWLEEQVAITVRDKAALKPEIKVMRDKLEGDARESFRIFDSRF